MANEGFLTRHELTKNSSEVEVLSHIHSDIFMQGKMLPDNIRISITFDRTNTPFCLNGAKAAEYTVFVTSFTPLLY